MSAVSELEDRLNYRFHDRALIAQALIHASAQKNAGDNERLEFLGDRVLGLLAAETLYRLFPHEEEGLLARRQAVLVQRQSLTRVAKHLNVGPCMRLSPGSDINDTILADAVEALMGAIWLDGGLDAARVFFARFWRDILQEQPHPPQDPKTALQEWSQGRGLPVPSYDVVQRTGPEHAPLFVVSATVKGYPPIEAKASSKRAAEREAARLLLARLGDQK